MTGPTEYGFEEGMTCGRPNEDGTTCEGVMGELERRGDCSCHISPPCNACLDSISCCAECGRSHEDDEE